MIQVRNSAHRPVIDKPVATSLTTATSLSRGTSRLAAESKVPDWLSPGHTRIPSLSTGTSVAQLCCLPRLKHKCQRPLLASQHLCEHHQSHQTICSTVAYYSFARHGHATLSADEAHMEHVMNKTHHTTPNLIMHNIHATGRSQSLCTSPGILSID